MIAMLAAMLVAPDVPAAPAAIAPMTIQAQFDKATADYDARRCRDAADGFAALARRLPPTSHSLPVVKARQGAALVCIGRSEEGAILLRAALADFTGTDDPTGDHGQALLELAAAEEDQLDHAGAARDLRTALALPSANGETFRISALAALARVTMFEDNAAALAAVDQALVLAAKQPKTTQKGPSIEAELHSLRGRVLLNHGDLKAAQSELNLAMRQLGGLTLKVDSADLAVRGDLAIAALLAHDEQTAHQLLTYTGAGHLEGGLPRVADKYLPPCGLAGVGVDDIAVVQFGISEDGTVMSVLPIYASRPGTLALTFAHAVAGWSWTAEQAAKVKPFFRAQTRLELRCTNSAARMELGTLLRDSVDAWFRERRLDAFEASAGSEAQNALLLKAELARREAKAGKGDPALLPVLIPLAANPAIPIDERWIAAERADAIGTAAGAAPPVRAAIAIAIATNSRIKATSRSASHSLQLKTIASAMAVPAIAADAQAAGVLSLFEADVMEGWGDDKQRAAILRPVSEDGRLAASDPIRVGAQLRLASIFAKAGDLSAARSAYERTGLNDQQCSLVDAEPALKGNPGLSTDFPTEALMWGFEGWVVNEFDIDAKGATQGVRAVVAYPPFVFDRAANSVFAKAHYTQSYRPQGGLGCRASNSTVTFRIPG